MAVPLVRREIGRRPGRLVLLVATVAVAVAFSTAAFGFAEQVAVQLDPGDSELGSLTLPAGTVVVSPRTTGVTTATSLDAELLAKVRGTPGVLVANGIFDQPVSFAVSADEQPERPVQLRGLVLSSSWDPERWELLEGREPTAPDEVAVDLGGAVVGDAPLGSSPRLELPTGTRTVRVVGRVAPAGSSTEPTRDPLAPGDVTDVALASAHVVLPAGHAAELLAAEGKVDRLSVLPEPGVDPQSLATRLRDELPAGLDVLTLSDRAQSIQGTVSGLDSGVRGAVGAFAALTVLVAALAVANVYAVVVAQRTRELGLLRLVGASRTQLASWVLAEASVVGIVGALIGLLAGSALAWIATSVVDPIGVEATLLVTPSMVVAAAVVGVAVSILGAAAPAVRAARAAPLDALSDTAAGADRSSPWWVGAGLLASGASLSLVPALGDGLDRRAGQVVAAAGLLVVLVGVAQLSRLVVVPLSGAASAALGPVAGVTARLGIGNVRRSPTRSAAAASTLMVTLALVGLVATAGASARRGVDAQFATTGTADLFVERRGLVRVDTSSLLARMGDTARAVRGAAVVAVEGVLVGPAGEETRVTTTGLGSISSTIDLEVTQGDPTAGVGDTPRARAEGPPDGVLLSERSAEALGAGVGDALVLRSTSGRETGVRVVATYRNTAFVGPAVVAWSAARELGAEGTFELAALEVRPGVSTARVQRELRRAAADFPKVRVHTPGEFAELNSGVADTVLRIIGVLLAGSVGIGMLGLGSTLALSTHERRRELVMLRAVGASRAQIASLVGFEAATLGAMASAVGLCAGTALAVVALRFAPPEFASAAVVPWQLVAAVAVCAVAVSWLVSIAVARPASRVPPAEAGAVD